MDHMNRRQFIKKVSMAGVSTLALNPIQAANPIRTIKVGYLHTLAVDGHIWIGEIKGYWKKHGLNLQLTRFYTGLELFQAMVGGSIDVLATGAVISNFPARGQGKVFLINNVEFATAQLWVNPERGVNSFKDLKGSQIATSIGTTAHVFLNNALLSNGIDPNRDVSIINQRMPDAVTAFISGSVPAVALWVPFNVQVRKRLPEAKMLVDASAYYPQAAIVGGWAARNDFYKESKDLLEKVIKVWIEANRDLTEKPDQTLKLIQREKYKDISLSDLREQYKAQKLFSSQEWVKKYRDGTVASWLDRVTDFYVSVGGISKPIRASKYFDPSLFLKQF